jgi:hypothetical protein
VGKSERLPQCLLHVQYLLARLQGSHYANDNVASYVVPQAFRFSGSASNDSWSGSDVGVSLATVDWITGDSSVLEPFSVLELVPIETGHFCSPPVEVG